MLTDAEANEFVDRWFSKHEAEIGSLIDASMAEADGRSLSDVVGRSVAVGMGLAVTSVVELLSENNRRWEARLKRAGIELP